MPGLLAALGAASIRPDPGPARSWVERELGRAPYRQSLGQRFLSWLGDQWQALQASALGASPLSTAAAALALVVLVVLVVLVASRVRREPLRGSGHEPVSGTGVLSAREHRAAADTALSAGDAGLAVVEAFRAVAAGAVERGVLEERPGRTAHELATELGPVFPPSAEELTWCSALFDRVFYGERSSAGSVTVVTAADARRVLALDDDIRAARPGPVPAPVHATARP
jgi:Domain of unknown function (DUF4129)